MLWHALLDFLDCLSTQVKQDPTTAGKELKRHEFQGEDKYDKYVQEDHVKEVTSKR